MDKLKRAESCEGPLYPPFKINDNTKPLLELCIHIEVINLISLILSIFVSAFSRAQLEFLDFQCENVLRANTLLIYTKTSNVNDFSVFYSRLLRGGMEFPITFV